MLTSSYHVYMKVYLRNEKIVKYRVRQIERQFAAFDLSVDDEISLLRLFPFPYKLQFHCCKAWLDLRVLFNPRPLFLFKQPPVLFSPLNEFLIQATFDLDPQDLVPLVDRKTIISLFIHFEPVGKTTARLHTRTIFR